jgi:hypothetical protein
MSFAPGEMNSAGKLDGADIFTADRGIGVQRGAPPFPLFQDQVYRPTSVEEAAADVRESVTRHPDMIKMWIDDLFGTAPKMSAAVFTVVIEQAHAIVDEAHNNKLRVAAHIFTLSDAKALVKAGVDVIAHSVRDQPVDIELVDQIRVWHGLRRITHQNSGSCRTPGVAIACPGWSDPGGGNRLRDEEQR